MRADLIIKSNDPGWLATGRNIQAGRGFVLEHSTLGGGQRFDYALRSATHYLALHDIVLDDGEILVGGEIRDTTRDLRGAISYFPKDVDVTGWSATSKRRNSYTAIFFDPGDLCGELGGRYGKCTPQPLVYIRNARLQSSLAALRDEISGGSFDALYAETLCMTLAIEVLRCAPALANGGLSHKQLTATLDFIAANIGQSINLNDLASAAALGRYHFAHAFKRSTGQSPSEFVRARRVEQAKTLLNETSRPIEVIAREVGFTGGTQFRRAFEAVQGCSPTEFRRHLGHPRHLKRTL